MCIFLECKYAILSASVRPPVFSPFYQSLHFLRFCLSVGAPAFMRGRSASALRKTILLELCALALGISDPSHALGQTQRALPSSSDFQKVQF